MANLVLGPMLRHVDDTSATVWVETSDACEVAARTRPAGSSRNCPLRTVTPGRGDFAAVAAAAGGARPGAVGRGAVRGVPGRPGWPGSVRRCARARISSTGRRSGARSTGRAGCWRASPGGPSAPATICVLSGDVHHQYVAEAHWPSTVDSRVHRIAASPVHHTVPLSQRLVFRFGWSRTLEKVTRALGRWDDVPPPPLSWTRTAGPFFGNALAELVVDGRAARFTLRRADAVREQQDVLTTVTSFELTR